ncbi:tetratricopeptide repeat protein [Shigella sonnei]
MRWRIWKKPSRCIPHNSNNDKWNSLLKVNRYWLAIQQGDAALKANNPDPAERLFQQARNVDNTDSYAVLGLGDVAMARKIIPPPNAITSRPCVWTAATLTPCAGWRIFTASSRQKKPKRISPRSLPASGAALMISNAACKTTVWHSRQRHWKTREMGAGGSTSAATMALDPGSVWITYRLSQDLWQAGQRSQADTLMRNLAQQKPNDPEQVTLTGCTSPVTTRTERRWRISTACRAGSGTAIFRSWLIDCKTIRCWKPLIACEKTERAEAEAMLRQQPPSSRIDLTLADWAQQRRDYTAARAAYQNVLTREPTNADAILRLTEVDIAAGDKAAARSQLAKLPAIDNASLNTQRRVALAQAQLGHTAAAQQTFNKLIPQAKSQPPSMESAMVLRDGAKFEALAGDRTQALETYKDAMVASGVTTTRPQDNDTFTRLTRNDEKDDWLKRGVRSDTADLIASRILTSLSSTITGVRAVPVVTPI